MCAAMAMPPATRPTAPMVPSTPRGGRPAAAACRYCAFRAAGIGRRGFDVFGEHVFRSDDDRVAVKLAVVLHADQRAFAACEVVFDNEVGAAAVVEGDEQVIAAARGVDAHRAGAGRRIGELVVGAFTASICATLAVFRLYWA